MAIRFKGREVYIVRDASRNDPYWNPEYYQYIVAYVDGSGRETAKESELDGLTEKDVEAAGIKLDGRKLEKPAEGSLKPYEHAKSQADVYREKQVAEMEAEQKKAKQPLQAEAKADKAKKQ